MSRPMVVIACMTWLLRIVGALTAPTSMALTCRVEEPSTASISDMLQSLHTIGMYLRSRRYCRPGFRNRVPVYRGAFVSPISISSRQQIEFQGIPRALLAFDG